MRNDLSEVFLIKTSDRKNGIHTLMDEFNLNEFLGKSVALKANFNSNDPFPASTHIDTLEYIIMNLKEWGIKEVVLAERSGMGNTHQILEDLGVFELSEKLDFKVIILDEEPKESWIKISNSDNHWLRGFYIPKLFLNSNKVVQTCCLKTHRFGGHFTLSLKNSVGIVAKRVPGGLYDYMAELHLSPYQRKMIAEINNYYKVDLIVLDAIKAFINKGPEKGDTIEPNLMLASKDRVAIDAVGIAILRSNGTTKKVMKGRIFELDQIRTATKLGIGVKSASDIKLTPLDDESHEDSEKIGQILEDQG
jgi:uncharacterized protein (DUF362 family)